MASKQQEIEVLESWEDIDESDVIEKNLSKYLASNTSYKTATNRSNVNLNGSLNIILTGEDALRSQYVPPEPTVKILKRPTKDVQNNSDSKSYQPKKTLKQREQEYEQARLRILGPAQSPEKTEERICSIANKVRPPVDMGGVVRLPKGPDGTKGFNLRR